MIWIVALGVALSSLIGMGLLVRALLFTCRPNEVLIFSGRPHTLPDGRVRGYQVMTDGRRLRLPVLERVDRMDLSTLPVDLRLANARCKGGTPLRVHAAACVKISSDPRRLDNAIERFLGHERTVIGEVAASTLEGHLRGVLAMLTPDEVEEDRLRVAECVIEEAEEDFEKLGLQLDALKLLDVRRG